MDYSNLPPEHQKLIDDLDIKKLTPEDLDSQTTGLIIGKIREKLSEINEATVSSIVEILELPVHIENSEDIKTIEDLRSYIYGLNFDSIEDIFTNHPINREKFLNFVKDFLK